MAIEVRNLETADEVGARLGRHPKTVLKLAREGELRAIKLGRRTIRFDPADVQAYLDRHRTGAA